MQPVGDEMVQCLSCLGSHALIQVSLTSVPVFVSVTSALEDSCYLCHTFVCYDSDHSGPSDH